MKTLIVGGVAGGASVAARLRRLDEQAEIVLFERGEFISFANCGLPYYVGGVITDEEDLTVQTPESFRERFHVDVRVHNEVLALHADAKTVRVKNHITGEEYDEKYDTLILSPGAAPVKPPIPGVDLARVFTLRNIPDTMRISAHIAGEHPKRAVVVGGGFIGLEMAENLVHAGLQVTIVEMAKHLLPPLDREMAVDLHAHAEENGVHLLLGKAVAGIYEEGGALRVATDGGDVETDMVILSVGVRPDTAFLQGSGLALGRRGAIVTDEHMRTNLPGVYALGDAAEVKDFVTGLRTVVPLAGPANKQGRIVADNVAGIPTTYKGTQGSAILKFFEMTAAATGANERTLKAAGIEYDKVYLYPASHAGYYPGATPMAMKVLFETPTGRILGAQIVGRDGVDKRCDVLATVIRMGGTADDLTELELCYAPPYSSAKDPVNLAGYVIQNVLSGRLQQFHWDQIASIPRDGSVQVVDARSPEEHREGAMKGAVNIPLDTLRDNLGTLDKTKPVYIHCMVGMRGYMAYRILVENGFEAYNLGGGCKLYNAVLADDEKYGG